MGRGIGIGIGEKGREEKAIACRVGDCAALMLLRERRGWEKLEYADLGT